jgi:Cu-Zn family superoxide dismutase
MNKATRRAAAAIVAMAAAAGLILVSSSTAGAVRPLAQATLRNAAGAAIGTVVFSGSGSNAERVEVQLTLPTDAPGLGSYHGFHVHTVGSCDSSFAAAMGHWKLDAASTHGSHTGDLPSILIGPDGTASATFETARFDVTDLFDADGSAVILHAGVDNFGNVPIVAGKYEDPNSWFGSATGTAATGDAGTRYGCGIVQPA